MLSKILNRTVSIKLLILISVILIIGTLVFLLISYFNKSLLQFSNKYSDLELKYDTCKDSVLTLNETINNYEKTLNNLPLPSLIKFSNIINPESAIKNDLMSHPEMIPYKGVLGGTMGFYFPENILILNHKWIYAEFEDGHIDGAMLLEYKLSKDSVVTWDVIDTFCLFYD